MLTAKLRKGWQYFTGNDSNSETSNSLQLKTQETNCTMTTAESEKQHRRDLVVCSLANHKSRSVEEMITKKKLNSG